MILIGLTIAFLNFEVSDLGKVGAVFLLSLYISEKICNERLNA